MNHDEFRAAYLAGAVSAGHETHLAGCAECRALVPELDATRSLLNDAAVWEEASPDAANRVAAAVGERAPASSTWRRAWWLLPAAAAAIVGAVLLTRPTSPDWEAELAGVRDTAGAVMSVEGWNTDMGTRLRLSVTDLDTAPDGYYYEFWMSADSEHVSAGTFRAGDGVELWAGVWRIDYPRLWVTLEPADADPAPSGRVVLDTG